MALPFKAGLLVTALAVAVPAFAQQVTDPTPGSVQQDPSVAGQDPTPPSAEVGQNDVTTTSNDDIVVTGIRGSLTSSART